LVDETIAATEADVATMTGADGLVASRNLVSSAEEDQSCGRSVEASAFGVDKLSKMEQMVDGAIAASELAIARGVLGAILDRLGDAAYQTEVVVGVSADELPAAARRAISEVLVEQWILKAAASSAFPPLDSLANAVDGAVAASEALLVSGAHVRTSK
jgi:hypothetical protein